MRYTQLEVFEKVAAGRITVDPKVLRRGSASHRTKFVVDQLVEVAKRTETGSNKPGGAGVITKVEILPDGGELYDVNYMDSRRVELRLPPSIIKERVWSDLRKSTDARFNRKWYVRSFCIAVQLNQQMNKERTKQPTENPTKRPTNHVTVMSHLCS